MFRKKSIYIIMLALGIALLGIALYIRVYTGLPRNVDAACIGVGAVLFGMSISGLCMKYWEKKAPDVMKQNKMEYLDDRNTMVRNRAKAKVADITQWLVMGIAYITILIDAPLWITLIIVSVFLLKNILEVFYMNKFQREM